MSADRSASMDDATAARDAEEIVAYVSKTRGLGNRAARRYVARKLTPTTLAWWRATGRFPVGFRTPDPQLQDDAGATLRTILASRAGRR